MEKKYDVTALGELLIDFAVNGESEQGNQLFEACPGGAPCNVLAMLNKLGRKTAFIGKVGDDQFGKLLKDTITNTGIEAKTDPDGNNYDLDNSIIKICEEENNGLKEKVSYILIKSTTTETDKRVRGIFDNNSSDKTVKVDSLGTKDVLDLKDLK